MSRADAVRVTALRDQVWTALRDRLEDVRRVAVCGIASPDDFSLVQMVMYAVVGDLLLNRAKENDDEGANS